MAADNPTPSPTPAGAAPAKKGGSPLAGLVIPLVLVLVAGVVFGVFYVLNQNAPAEERGKILDGYLVGAEKYAALSPEFTDADGDLVADVPKEAKEPAELWFTEIAGDNPDRSEKTWAAFLEHLSKVTGKPCKYLKKVDVPAGGPAEPREGDREGDPGPPPEPGAVTSFDAQLKALKDGKLHVTAFTTGQVRRAVNEAGFRPLVVPADQDGKFAYQVKVLVPKNSPVRTLADLKGKTLAVSSMSSNSGAKAPLVMLADAGLDVRKDVALKVVGRYEAAVAQVLKGEADATCLPSDLLARELARGEPTAEEKARGRVRLTEDQIRVIDLPGDYPKLCFGVSHALPRPLADKVLAGFKTFRFEGLVGEKYKADGAVQFLPVEYKKDWEAVRQIDDRLVEILKKK